MNTTSARERYRQLEHSAPTSLIATALVVAASLYAHVPRASFLALNVIAGALLFFCWRFALQGRSVRTAVFAFASLITALIGLSISPDLSLPLLLTQGFGTMASAMFSAILIAKKLEP